MNNNSQNYALKNNVISELEKHLQNIEKLATAESKLYKKMLESTLERIRTGYYDNLSGFASTDELVRDLKGLGFYELANQVVRSQFL